MDYYYLRSLRNKLIKNDDIIINFTNCVIESYLERTPIISAEFELKNEPDPKKLWTIVGNFIKDAIKDDAQRREAAFSFNIDKQRSFDIEIDLGYTIYGDLKNGVVYLVYTDHLSTLPNIVLKSKEPKENQFFVDWYIKDDRYMIRQEVGSIGYLVDKHGIREQTMFQTGFKLVRIAKDHDDKSSLATPADEKINERFSKTPCRVGNMVMTQLKVSPDKGYIGYHYPEDKIISEMSHEKLGYVEIWYKIQQYGIPDGSGCTNVSKYLGGIKRKNAKFLFDTELAYNEACCHFYMKQKKSTRVLCPVCHEESSTLNEYDVITLHPLGSIVIPDDQIVVCGADLCDQIECGNHRHEDGVMEVGDEKKKLKATDEGDYSYIYVYDNHYILINKNLN